MSGAYTIRRTHGCIVIEGAIPIMDLAGLMRGWERERAEGDAAWIVDSLLSAHFKCNMVVGPPEACSAWRKKLGIVFERPVRPSYRLVDNPHPGIICGNCGRTSYNRNDIAQRYCGICNTYLGE